MENLQTIAAFLFVIAVMILIHEWGHYVAARFFKVRVETFSLGFGPRLFGWRRGDTDFRVSAIPLGGYVKMTGEQFGDGTDPGNFDAPVMADDGALLNKPRWQRMIIAFAGPLMNIVLAVVLLTGLYMYRFPQETDPKAPARIGLIVPESPAAQAGLQEGDIIETFNGKQNPNWEDIVLTEVGNAGLPLPVVVRRDGNSVVATVTPRVDPKDGIGRIGWRPAHEVQVARAVPGGEAARVGLKSGDVLLSFNGQSVRALSKLHQLLKAGKGAPTELVYRRDGKPYTVSVTPKPAKINGEDSFALGVELTPSYTYVQLPFPQAFEESVSTNVKTSGLILQFFRGLLERRMSAKSMDGPIGIASMAGEAARRGWADMVGLMASISLNLAIFNLLPIPILDGGTILMLLIEMIIRRDMPLNWKEKIFQVGFLFLMGLIVFVLYNDISKKMAGAALPLSWLFPN